ncbi:MAG: hypothetical protein LUQ01_02570 [Methanolinea sp.]|nr:hypothetical protein [Methanolinea sp.]
MRTGKKRRKTPDQDLPAIPIAMLHSALDSRKDYVLTWETVEDGRCVMHLFSGDLITPCMRGTLANRAGLGMGEGSSHICLFVPESGTSAPCK